MASLQKKSMSSPDETRDMPKGKIELANLEGMTFGLATFEPGWKWSEDVKPIAKTDSCQAKHTAYQISGRMHVVMDDGTEAEIGPGEVAIIPPGHDGWVVGDEPAVMLDISGMGDYAKS